MKHTQTHKLIPAYKKLVLRQIDHCVSLWREKKRGLKRQVDILKSLLMPFFDQAVMESYNEYHLFNSKPQEFLEAMILFCYRKGILSKKQERRRKKGKTVAEILGIEIERREK